MGTTQARRTAEKRCRECGDEMDRSTIRRGQAPVYCSGCLKARKAHEAEIKANARKSVADMRRALGLPPQEEA